MSRFHFVSREKLTIHVQFMLRTIHLIMRHATNITIQEFFENRGNFNNWKKPLARHLQLLVNCEALCEGLEKNVYEWRIGEKRAWLIIGSTDDRNASIINLSVACQFAAAALSIFSLNRTLLWTQTLLIFNTFKIANQSCLHSGVCRL